MKNRVALGLRFSNTDYTFAVMNGTKATPEIIEVSSIACPKGFQRTQTLSWLVQEIEAIMKKHPVQIVVIKRFEGRSKGNTFEERVENEASAYIASANNGIHAVYKKVSSTIAKDLGLKGRGKYIKTKLNTSVIDKYTSYSEKEKDAIHSAWSELK